MEQDTIIAGWFCAIMLLIVEMSCAIATISGVSRFAPLTVVIGFMALAMTGALKFRENGVRMRAGAQSPRVHSERPMANAGWRLAA